MGLNNTGLTEKSAENFLIDSATVFTGLKFENGEYTGTPLGATRGGAEINIELSYRKIEVDGASVMDVKGLTVLESGTASVKTTLIEITPGNLARAMNSEVVDAETNEAPEGSKIVKPKRFLSDSDYIENVAIIGRLSGSGKTVIFILDNGLVKTPFNLATEDNNEAGIEIEITAHASITQLQKDELPWRTVFPAAPTAAGGTE